MQVELKTITPSDIAPTGKDNEYLHFYMDASI